MRDCQPTVLLTGGTSQVGIFALPRLLAAGYPVIALSRRISRPAEPADYAVAPGLRWVHLDAAFASASRKEVEKTTGILQAVKVLLSCGPVALAVQLAPLCPQLQRVICISTSSVYTKWASPNAFERNLITGIKASEDQLKRYCEESRVALVLLRPTLIYGCGLDRNVSRIARLARCLHFFPVAGQASGRRQPVHADDLAKLVLRILMAEDLTVVECPVAGGSVLTYRELVQRIITGLGLSAHIVQAPPRILAALVRVVSWLPWSGGLNAEFVLRQNLDLVFDDSWLRHRLGFDPRPFEPTAEDFKIPDAARALQPF